MTYVIGRRNGREAYPESSRGVAAALTNRYLGDPAGVSQPRTYPEANGGRGGSAAFAFDQNATPYTVIDGDPPLQIATASITVAAGSRVKIEGLAAFDGAVDVGRAILTTVLGGTVNGVQSFGVAAGLSFRTCNYLAVTDVQPGGLVTVALLIQVVGNAGARIDAAGSTVLTLTEIPA